MTHRAAVASVMIALALSAVRLQAQSADRSVVLGIAAYRGLEYDSAVVHLRRALAARGRDSLVSNRRPDVLTYLGASELLRGNNTLATSAFVDAVAFDPRYRIDDLVFPPQITNAFEQARLSTAYFIVNAPTEQTLRVRTTTYPLHLWSSAPGQVTVSVLRPGGEVLREVYSGPIKDALDVSWDGLDATGKVPATGSFVLQVRASGVVTHTNETRVALRIDRLPVDTLPHPVQPATKQIATGTSHSSAALRSLLVGTLAGGTAIFLPTIVGSKDNAMSERFVVGGTLGAAGVIGFFSQRERGRRVRVDSVATTRALDLWRRDLDRVKQENARRLSTPQLRITTSPANTRAGGDQ